MPWCQPSSASRTATTSWVTEVAIQGEWVRLKVEGNNWFDGKIGLVVKRDEKGVHVEVPGKAEIFEVTVTEAQVRYTL